MGAKWGDPLAPVTTITYRRVMRIAIAGASGLLGSGLTGALTAEGHEVLRLVRRVPRGDDERLWDPTTHWIDRPGLDDVDAVVVLSGAGIGARPWTSRYRRAILTSRLDPVQTVARALVDAQGVRPRTLMVASAVGVYGADRGDEVLTEESTPGDDFLARVCRVTEGAARQAADEGARVVTLRTGIVLSALGGYLATQRPLFLAGGGGPIDSGAQWLPWITREDHIRAMVHLLTGSELSGPVNLAAPGAVRQRDFARAYAASLHRPSVLTLPSALLVPFLGPDMVKELLRAGQHAVPDRLLRDGFAFGHARLDDALSWLGEERAAEAS